MNIPDPERPGEQLCHVVNKMLWHNGYIFCFNPNRSQSTREIVVGLLVYLQGMWTPMVEPSKFNKFFTGPAIERAADAWWDTKERCIAKNAKLEDLINQDIDLMFPADTITVDITQIQETEADVRMSTGSISTFCTTATPQAKAGARPSKKHESTQTSKEMSADQASGGLQCLCAESHRGPPDQILSIKNPSQWLRNWDIIVKHYGTRVGTQNPGMPLKGMIGGEAGSGEWSPQLVL